MKTFYASLVSLAVVAGTFASLLPRDPTFCTNAKTLSTAWIPAQNGKVVELTTLACDSSSPNALRAADIVPTTTDIPPAVPTEDVCAEICSNVCADSGSLPPVTEDCATIVDAITILNGSVAPSFEVSPNRAQVLTFGTCRFFFENFSPGTTLSYCWLSFAQVASAAASACLPPVQPVNSEGLCIPTDGLWRVGVAHS